MNHIDEIVERLEEIVRASEAAADRAGYFAALYLRVTETVRDKIGTGYFDDDARMERFDVFFAGLYLSAYDRFGEGLPLPEAWAVAFDTTADERPVVLRHLLLGMNAHINVDLGHAAAEVAPGALIETLRDDFSRINDVLASLVPTVMAELGEISPVVHLLDDLARHHDEAFINFSMSKARDFAWAFACRLAPLDDAERAVALTGANRVVAAIGRRIVTPGPRVAAVVDAVARRESRDVASNIAVLDRGDVLVPGGPDRDDLERWDGVGVAPNHVYYFDLAEGSWRGTVRFDLHDRLALGEAEIGRRNTLLVLALAGVQRLFGDGVISATVSAFPEEGAARVARSVVRITKAGVTVFTSSEDHVLSEDGTGVEVRAHVRFGPIPFLFHPRSVYRARVYAGGKRALHFGHLLGAPFVGRFLAGPEDDSLDAGFSNDFSTTNGHLRRSRPGS